MKYNKVIVKAFYAAHGMTGIVFEHRFHPVRLWKFDVAWPASKVAIECDGGIWVRGGHCRGAQIKKDWEKRNTAQGMDWKVLLCEPKDICTNEIVEQVKECMT